MHYYNEIKNKLIDNEVYQKVKDYSKEKNKVFTYYEIGKLLFEAGSKYGESIINEYSKKLIVDVGKKYNYRTLYRMRKLYEVFQDKKLTTMLSKLTWSHYLLLLSLNDNAEIYYYIMVSEEPNLDVRGLNNKIKSNEYKRLDEKTKSKLINNEKTLMQDNTIGIIICKKDNKFIMEYCSDERIYRIVYSLK